MPHPTNFIGVFLNMTFFLLFRSFKNSVNFTSSVFGRRFCQHVEYMHPNARRMATAFAGGYLRFVSLNSVCGGGRGS